MATIMFSNNLSQFFVWMEKNLTKHESHQFWFFFGFVLYAPLSNLKKKIKYFRTPIDKEIHILSCAYYI